MIPEQTCFGTTFATFARSVYPPRWAKAFGVSFCFWVVPYPGYPCNPWSLEFLFFSRNGPPNPAKYSSARPEMTSHEEEPNKAKTAKGNIKSTKREKMNLKKLMQFNNPPGKIQNNMTTPHLKTSVGRSPLRLALLLIPLALACLALSP